jgi:hypothetical protein
MFRERLLLLRNPLSFEKASFCFTLLTGDTPIFSLLSDGLSKKSPFLFLVAPVEAII